MDATTTQALDEALELLNAGKDLEAAKVLAKIVTRHPGNERAWHMLSYALTDPVKQAYALQRVLQINPRNRPAKSHLGRLDRQLAPPPPPETEPTETPPVMPVVPPAAGGERPEQAVEPFPARPIEIEPAPVAAMPATSGQTWASASAAVAVAAGPRFVPMPGTAASPAVQYSHWQRLKVRAFDCFQPYILAAHRKRLPVNIGFSQDPGHGLSRDGKQEEGYLIPVLFYIGFYSLDSGINGWIVLIIDQDQLT